MNWVLGPATGYFTEWVAACYRYSDPKSFMPSPPMAAPFGPPLGVRAYSTTARKDCYSSSVDSPSPPMAARLGRGVWGRHRCTLWR
ncbi:MAG: hypothetical protein ACRC8Y_21505 [Chroococcales cyanobacterium]